MSFRCERCSTVADRPTRVIVERKMVDHLAGKSLRGGPHNGTGPQIVREMSLCAECASSAVEVTVEQEVTVMPSEGVLTIAVAPDAPVEETSVEDWAKRKRADA